MKSGGVDMKRIRCGFGRAAIALAAAALGLSTTPALAQNISDNPPVAIKNDSGGARKICFHKSEKVTLFAIGCITLKAGGRFYWDRERQFTSFKVKVYEKRSLFDKYLYTRGMPFDTGEIVIGAGSRFDFSRFKKPVNRYLVRVCNTQYDDKVQFSLAADTPRGQFSEGWWSVERGSCKTIPFGKRLKDSWNIPYGQNLRLFYRARTFGKKPVFWNKGDRAQVFCHDKNKWFVAKLKSDGSCATGQDATTFRLLAMPSQNSEELIYLSF